jgi:hypothetical protein
MREQQNNLLRDLPSRHNQRRQPMPKLQHATTAGGVVQAAGDSAVQEMRMRPSDGGRADAVRVPWVLQHFRSGRQADCGGVDHPGTAGQAAERESSQAAKGQALTGGRL